MTPRPASIMGLAVALSGLALQGCAVSGSPAWDGRFGEATRQLGAQQLIAPAAPQRNADAGARVDGRSAREARDRYLDSYAAPPASNVAPVNVGGNK